MVLVTQKPREVRPRTPRLVVAIAVVAVVATPVLVYPYLGLDRSSSRIPVTTGLHYAVLVVHVLFALLLIVPSWRIFERAGFSGLLSLFHLVPVVGPFIVMAILAFSDWPSGERRPPPVRP